MADDPSVTAGTESARRSLERSEKSMEDLLTALDEMVERILNGEDVTIAEMSKARVALSYVRAQLVTEVNKYEERMLVSDGLVEHAPLNFDDIRRDIGRRLDRIRGQE